MYIYICIWMDRHVCLLCLFQADSARYKLPPTNIDPAMSCGLGRLPNLGDSAILRIFVCLGVGTYAKQNTNKMPRYAKRILQCQGMYFKLVSFIAIGWHDQRDQVSPRTSCEFVGCPCQKRWHGMGCCFSEWVDLQKNRQNVVSYALVVIFGSL